MKIALAIHSSRNVLVKGHGIVPCTCFEFNKYALILNCWKMLDKGVNRMNYKTKKNTSNLEKNGGFKFYCCSKVNQTMTEIPFLH